MALVVRDEEYDSHQKVDQGLQQEKFSKKSVLDYVRQSEQCMSGGINLHLQ